VTTGNNHIGLIRVRKRKLKGGRNLQPQRPFYLAYKLVWDKCGLCAMLIDGEAVTCNVTRPA